MVAITGRSSARGTTKPKPLRSCPTWSRAEGDGRRGRAHVLDRREVGGGERRDRAQQVAARPGRRGQHDGVGDHAAAVGELAGRRRRTRRVRRSRRRIGHRRHAGAAVQALGRQRGDDGVAQVLQARPERVEVGARAGRRRRAPPPGAGGRPAGGACAAAAFCRALRRLSIARMRLRCSRSISRNIGKVARTLMLLRVAGVDAGDDGLGDALQRLVAEAPADEVAEALVEGRAHVPSGPMVAAPPRGSSRSMPMRTLPGQLIRPLSANGTMRVGHHEDDALGQLVQAPAREDEALADVLVGVQEAVADAELAGQPDRPGLLDDGRVRAAFDDEAVAAHGLHLAAEARLLLVEVPVDGGVRGARVFEHARRPQARPCRRRRRRCGMAAGLAAGRAGLPSSGLTASPAYAVVRAAGRMHAARSSGRRAR